MPPEMTASIRIELAALVGAMKEGDTGRMMAAMERLDATVAQHGPSLDPRLAHFLERRSYAKALDFIGGDPNVPAGSCGPGKSGS